MRFNYKKIAAIGASVLLAGMTTGFAAAAAFPAPFVQGGTANVAIVYGTGAGVSPLDVVQAGNIQTALASSLGSASGTTSTIVSSGGDLATLDTSGSRIWLNTSLSSVRQVLTASYMPNLLAVTNFNGNINVQVTPSIVMNSGLATTTQNNKVVFVKPTGSSDPVVGISMGVSPVATNALYNATVSFSSAVNFTDPNSQGQVLTLFGNQYTVASTTSASNGLILFGSAQTVTLTQGSAGAVSTATVTVSGTPHTITLTNVGSSTAYISVDGSGAQAINSGSSRLINGVNIAITSVASSTAGGNSATVLVGANQLTLLSGQAVQVGTNNNVIQGTYVDFNGASVTNMSKLTIAVSAPNVLQNVITANKSFVDPVFGTFLVGFAGLNPTVAYAPGTGIQVTTNGNYVMNVAFNDYKNNSESWAFAYNNSGAYNLSDASGNSIYPYESANLTQNSWTIVGNQDHAHLLQLVNVQNVSGSNNYALFQDTVTNTQVKTSVGSSTTQTLNLDGYTYSVTFGNGGGSGAIWASIKYPGVDSSSTNVFGLYPTIQTSKGVQMMLYAPLNVSLASFGASGNTVGTLNVPNGNGWSQISIAQTAGAPGNWTIGGTTSVNLTALGTTNATNVTVTPSGSKLSFVFTAAGSPSGVANQTMVYVVQPGTAATQITTPSIIELEGKDANNNYNAIVVATQTPSSNLVGVANVYFTSATYQSGGQTLYSNNKLTQYMDGYGAIVTVDTSTSGQPIATLNNPASQSYSQVYVSQASATIGGGNSTTQLGNILVKDSAVSSVVANNLIVVGGSCINSAAATLVGGAYCGDAWTSATGVGTGQFLIQSYNSTINNNGLVALLVAGFDASDTVNAATYLTMQKPDTSMGNKYIGTTSTSAQLQVTH